MSLFSVEPTTNRPCCSMASTELSELVALWLEKSQSSEAGGCHSTLASVPGVNSIYPSQRYTILT